MVRQAQARRIGEWTGLDPSDHQPLRVVILINGTDQVIPASQSANPTRILSVAGCH